MTLSLVKGVSFSMPVSSRFLWRTSVALVLALSLVCACSSTPHHFTPPSITLTQISSDPYTNKAGQHKTEVEPDTFAFGNTVVAAFKVGRFFKGGASNIGWATSINGGRTWTYGLLPGTTAFAGGSYDKVSDPSVAYDARHNVRMISYLAHKTSPSAGVLTNVLASRSTTGGVTWSAPVLVKQGGPSTSGSTGHLVLAFYYYPNANCTSSTCQLDVGSSSSTDGGNTWSRAMHLAGPMMLSWLASTSKGSMVGDYISTSFSGGKAYPVFAVATAPGGGAFNEAMFTISDGLT